MKLTKEELLSLPENIKSFAGSKIWKETSKEELINRLKDTDFSEIRRVADYLDLYIGDTWALTIGKFDGRYYVRNVGFENEKYMYLIYRAATGAYAAGISAAGSWAALMSFSISIGRFFSRRRKGK